MVAIGAIVEGFIFNLIVKLLLDAITNLLKRREVLTELVITAIRTMIEGVNQDGIWRGRGADHFVYELTNEVMPAAQKLVDVLDSMKSNLEGALSDLSEADNTASQTASALSAEFKNVYAA